MLCGFLSCFAFWTQSFILASDEKLCHLQKLKIIGNFMAHIHSWEVLRLLWLRQHSADSTLTCDQFVLFASSLEASLIWKIYTHLQSIRYYHHTSSFTVIINRHCLYGLDNRIHSEFFIWMSFSPQSFSVLPSSYVVRYRQCLPDRLKRDISQLIKTLAIIKVKRLLNETSSVWKTDGGMTQQV